MSRSNEKLFDQTGDMPSYMPSSVAGCVIMGMTILLRFGIISIGGLASRYFQAPMLSCCSWIVAGMVFIAFMRFAHRHS